jgi:hypothetical protein
LSIGIRKIVEKKFAKNGKFETKLKILPSYSKIEEAFPDKPSDCRAVGSSSGL